MRRASGIARLVAGAVGVVALVVHLFYSLGSGGSALPNFFSYFTMQSAIAAVVLWLIGGVIALRIETDPRWLIIARLLTTTYQLVSGVVYTIIVAEAVTRGLSIQVPPSSQVLHYWMPAYALIDWLLAPGRPRSTWKHLVVVPIFPLAWGGFTLIRGANIGWYPYFFLDPYQVSGVAELVAYSATVLGFILAVSAALILAARFLPRSVRPGARRSVGQERLEAESRSLDELVVAQLGKGDRAFAADEADEHG